MASLSTSLVLSWLHRTTAQQYNHEELLLMKTQDIGYVLCKAQSEQKVWIKAFAEHGNQMYLYGILVRSVD